MPEAPATRTQRVEGGFDANLDFPFDNPKWAQFAAETHCSVASYTDLDVLTTAVRQGLFDFSYLPSSSCYFLRGSPYRGVVSALTARTHRPAQNSVLVVAAANPATTWHDLRGKRLGYINTYCTTSYFAPSILLARDGIGLKDFFDAVPVKAWQGQIDAVVAGSIDATMVFEDVWLATPDNARRTKILARIDDLPTPPVIVRSDFDAGIADRLKQTLLAMPAEGGANALYAGFAEYQDARMERLFADLDRLPGRAHAA